MPYKVQSTILTNVIYQAKLSMSLLDYSHCVRIALRCTGHRVRRKEKLEWILVGMYYHIMTLR